MGGERAAEQIKGNVTFQAPGKNSQPGTHTSIPVELKNKNKETTWTLRGSEWRKDSGTCIPVISPGDTSVQPGESHPGGPWCHRPGIPHSQQPTWSGGVPQKGTPPMDFRLLEEKLVSGSSDLMKLRPDKARMRGQGGSVISSVLTEPGPLQQKWLPLPGIPCPPSKAGGSMNDYSSFPFRGPPFIYFLNECIRLGMAFFPKQMHFCPHSLSETCGFFYKALAVSCLLGRDISYGHPGGIRYSILTCLPSSFLGAHFPST